MGVFIGGSGLHFMGGQKLKLQGRRAVIRLTVIRWAVTENAEKLKN